MTSCNELFVLLFAESESVPGLPGIWLPMLAVGLLYYFVVFRPEKAQRSKHTDLLNNLKKNDHVITAGGIHGVVVNAQPGSAEIVLRIDESTNTRIHINRSSISQITDSKEKAATT